MVHSYLNYFTLFFLRNIITAHVLLQQQLVDGVQKNAQLNYFVVGYITAEIWACSAVNL